MHFSLSKHCQTVPMKIMLLMINIDDYDENDKNWNSNHKNDNQQTHVSCKNQNFSIHYK